MNFAYPGFLFALFALSIPILIHLFNFRKFKKIVFTNVRFLHEIKKDTQSRTRLKHLLVLVCRLFAIAFIVFAFSKPFIPGEQSNSNKGTGLVSIFIDNSFSMEAIGRNGRLLDEAKRNAAEIVESHSQSTLFQVLSFNFEARHQRFVNKEQALLFIDELEIGSSTRNISEVMTRQSDAFQSYANEDVSKTAFIVSDFQKIISPQIQFKPDSSIRWQLLPIQSDERSNLFIDSVWFSSPIQQKNSPITLNIRIVNDSKNDVENIPCKLHINGNQKGLCSFTVPAKNSLVQKIPFTLNETGIQQGRVEISDYPVNFDDVYFFNFSLNSSIPILVIGPEQNNKFIEGVYSDAELFQVKKVSDKNVDYSTLSSYRFILLDELDEISSGLANELLKFIQSGGSLAIFPSNDDPLWGYNDFLSNLNAGSYSTIKNVESKISNLPFNDPLLENVFEKIPENIDLPLVKKYHPMITHSTNGAESLARLENKDSYLNRFSIGKGLLYLFASAANMEASTLPKHAIFVPLMHRIAMFSQASQAKGFVIGQDEIIETNLAPSSSESALHLRSSDGEFDIIPEKRTMNGMTNLHLHNQISKAGSYMLGEEDARAVFAFNYDRRESMMTCLNAAELSDLGDELNVKVWDRNEDRLGSLIGEYSQGIQLWKYCILLGLLFFFIETLLLRFYR